jgi:hypothetical protein
MDYNMPVSYNTSDGKSGKGILLRWGFSYFCIDGCWMSDRVSVIRSSEGEIIYAKPCEYTSDL